MFYVTCSCSDNHDIFSLRVYDVDDTPPYEEQPDIEVKRYDYIVYARGVWWSCWGGGGG